MMINFTFTYKDLVWERIKKAPETRGLVPKVPRNVAIRHIGGPSVHKQATSQRKIAIDDQLGDAGGCDNSKLGNSFK